MNSTPSFCLDAGEEKSLTDFESLERKDCSFSGGIEGLVADVEDANIQDGQGVRTFPMNLTSAIPSEENQYREREWRRGRW